MKYSKEAVMFWAKKHRWVLAMAAVAVLAVPGGLLVLRGRGTSADPAHAGDHDHQAKAAGESGAHADEHGHGREAAGDESGHGHERGEGKQDGHGGHEEEGEHRAGQVGEGKAVEAFDEHAGRIKLSARAVAGLGIKAGGPRAEVGGLVVSADAVVVVQGRPFVYLVQPERWFKRQSVVTGLRRGDGGIQIRSGLAPGQWVVVAGALSLRTVELDLLAGDEGGHGH